MSKAEIVEAKQTGNRVVLITNGGARKSFLDKCSEYGIVATTIEPSSRSTASKDHPAFWCMALFALLCGIAVVALAGVTVHVLLRQQESS